MTWRLRIVHKTGFEYNSTVYSSYNEVRLTPRGDARQTVVSNRVLTSPVTRIFRYTDYWGTHAISFDLHAPHTALEVTGTSVVETEYGEPPESRYDWDHYEDANFKDKYNEMLSFSEYIPYEKALAEIAENLKADKDPLETIRAICSWVYKTIEYGQGTTGVHTSAVFAYQEGKGVCQDYAHLSLLLLRSVGIPARYVSGYLHPVRDAKIGETVTGESHAWIEAYIGEWWGFDPTNDTEITPQYVAVSSGRDYSDVPPLKGIISGGGASELDVIVEMTRLV